MKAKILRSDKNDQHKYDIVASDRDTGQRIAILKGLTHEQALDWEPDAYHKKSWKYFKVARSKNNDGAQKKGQNLQNTSEVAVQCPICGGNGKVPKGFYDQTSGQWSAAEVRLEDCRSCKGTGIIWTLNRTTNYDDQR